VKQSEIPNQNVSQFLQDKMAAKRSQAGSTGETVEQMRQRILAEHGVSPVVQKTNYDAYGNEQEKAPYTSMFANGGWFHEGQAYPITENSDTHLSLANDLRLTDQQMDFDGGVKEAIFNGAIRVKPGLEPGYKDINFQAPNTSASRLEIKDLLDYYPNKKADVRVEFFGGNSQEFDNVEDAQNWLENPRADVSSVVKKSD
jgi:hypothetical protein